MSSGRLTGKAHSGDAPKASWIPTFTDLLQLLMTFFVLLLTMSSMDSKKLKQTFGMFTGAVGTLGTGSGQEESVPPLTIRPAVVPNTFDTQFGPDMTPAIDNEELDIKKLLEEAARQSVESKLIEVERTENGIRLRVAAQAAFTGEGRPKLSDEAQRLLLDIADLAASRQMGLTISTNVEPTKKRRVEAAWKDAAHLTDQAAQIVHTKGQLPFASLTVKAYGRPSKLSVGGVHSGLSVELVSPEESKNHGK